MSLDLYTAISKLADEHNYPTRFKETGSQAKRLDPEDREQGADYFIFSMETPRHGRYAVISVRQGREAEVGLYRQGSVKVGSFPLNARRSNDDRTVDPYDVLSTCDITDAFATLSDYLDSGTIVTDGSIH
jgi:hypothetical protein